MIHKQPEGIEATVQDMREYALHLASMDDLTQIELAVVIQAQQRLVEYLDELLEQPSLVALGDWGSADPATVGEVVTNLIWKEGTNESK